jgi:hypothetical protein
VHALQVLQLPGQTKNERGLPSFLPMTRVQPLFPLLCPDDLHKKKALEKSRSFLAEYP